MFKVDYDPLLVGCVDFNVESEWFEDNSMGMMLNKLFRYTLLDDMFGTKLYDCIINNFKWNDSKVLKTFEPLTGKYATLETLINDVGKSKVARLFLQTRILMTKAKIKTLYLLVDEEITNMRLPSKSNSKKLSMDKQINKDLFPVLGKYLTTSDLLRVSRISRKWYDYVMNLKFAKGCFAFKSQVLTLVQVYDYSKKCSSQWHFSGIKMINIQASAASLYQSEFPTFYQDSIQYIETPVWHFDKVPASLKAMKIRGGDRSVYEAQARKWQYCNFHHLKISVAYRFKNESATPILPDATTKFYDQSVLFCGPILDDLSNGKVSFVGLQDTWVRYFQSNHYNVNENIINKETPNTKLVIIDSKPLCNITNMLKHNCQFDKFVEEIIFVLNYGNIRKDLSKFLSAITNIKNGNKEKRLCVLFYYDTKNISNPIPEKEMFHNNDSLIFNWMNDNWFKFKRNANIGEFVFGIFNITEDMEKYSYCVDLMKISDEKRGSIRYEWENALRYKMDRFQVHQECAWEKYFKSIESKMID